MTDLTTAQPLNRAREAAKWLGFQSARSNYLLLLAHTGEVLQSPDITHVPFTHCWFRGVVSVRGSLLGVIDVDEFLSLHGQNLPARVAKTDAPADPSSAVAYSLHKKPAFGHLVTLSAALNLPFSLAMGTMLGLRGPHEFEVQRQDDAMASPLVAGVHHDRDNTRWIEIDLPALIANARMRSVGIAPGLA